MTDPRFNIDNKGVDKVRCLSLDVQTENFRKGEPINS